MPIRAARAALSASGFGAGVGVSDSYWLGAVYRATGNETGQAVHVDNSGNVYIGGGLPSTGAYLAKFDSNFTQQWVVQLGPTTCNIRDINADNSGNVYVCGDCTVSSTDWYVAKLSSAGTVSWGYTCADSGTDSGQNVQLDSSGNVYVTGSADSAGTGDQLVLKWNSAGVRQWVSRYRNTATASSHGAFGVLNSAETFVYAVNQMNDGGVRTFGMNRVDVSSGAASNGFSFTPSDAMALIPNSLCFDPSGTYLYLAGQALSTTRAEIVKTDLSGNVQWARKFTNGGSEDFTCVVCDAAGNVYASGTSGSNTAIVVKYDSSGTLVWHRAFSNMGNRVWRVRATATAVYCVSYFTSGAGPSGSGFDIFVAKIPSGGSRTGTYSLGSASVTYGATASGASASDTVTGSATTVASASATVTDTSNTTASTPTTTNVKATI